MQWWNNFVDWLTSEDGWRILSTVVFPFLAIIVAGLIAAMIGRGATRRLIVLHDREQRVSTVASLIGAARRASKWNSLSAPEQQHAEHLAHDADVSVRLLPLAGASMTADWAAHEIAEMKKNSVSFSFQAEQSLMDFRDRLVEWQSKPSRAKKLFKADLDLWAYESAQEDRGLVEKQQAWAKQQIAAETSQGPAEPESTPTSAAPEVTPITWGEPESPAPASTGTGQGALTRPAPTYVAPGQAAISAAEDSSRPQMPTYGVPAATGSPSPAPETRSTQSEANTGEQDQIPNPVSAQTVRQRVLPDDFDEDDLR